MATLTQLRDRVSKKIGLDNSVAGDQGLIDSWIGEGYEFVLTKTRCKVSQQTVTPGANADYTLTSSILAILEMYTTSGGQDYLLRRVTPQEIINFRRSSADEPTRFYALVGHDKILFYPTPGASDTFTMYYVARPTALAAGGDSPSDIPAEWHKLIEWYALAEGADYDDDSSSQQGERYRSLFDQGLKDFRKAMRFKGGTRLAQGKVNTRRRRYSSRDPSADVRW